MLNIGSELQGGMHGVNSVVKKYSWVLCFGMVES